MKNKRINKLSAFFFAGVFALFNIGIPVVLASCPMGSMSSSVKCDGCADQTSGESISKFADMSCCATKIVADRNTTEFNKPDVQRDRGLIGSALVFELPIESVVNLNNSLHTVFAADIPPPKAGIPVLISSLLI